MAKLTKPPLPQHVLVTGAGGFIGRHLVAWLMARGCAVTCVVRRAAALSAWLQAAPPLSRPGALSLIEIDDIGGAVDWAPLLQGVDAVVHLAARVHVMDETAADPPAAFRHVNVQGTQRLAEAAAAAGVARFVYLSTIKVNGERTQGRPFRADDPPAPQDAYARSKLEAEQWLWRIGLISGTQFVVIRPPLVYGPGVQGNFARLLRALARGVPLPLGAVDNRRSLVSVDNLVDLIGVCLVHPAAAGEVFLVSDGADFSTPQLLRALAAGLGRRPRLFALPVGLLRGLAGLLGRRAQLERLVDSLQVDIAATRERLGWTPPQSAAQGLRQTVQALRDD